MISEADIMLLNDCWKNGTVQIVFEDGEEVVAQITFILPHFKDVNYEMLSTNREEKYANRSKNVHYNANWSDIKSVKKLT